jgi:hypothetical protein
LVYWALLGVAIRASATPDPALELRYEVDPALRGCPDAGELRSMVAQALDSVPSPDVANLQVTVRARLAEGGIEGELNWSTANHGRLGSRRFSTRNRACREIMATIAFALAVQLELTASGSAGGMAKPPLPPGHADSTGDAPPDQGIAEQKPADQSDHKSTDRRAAALSDHKAADRKSAAQKNLDQETHEPARAETASQTTMGNDHPMSQSMTTLASNQVPVLHSSPLFLATGAGPALGLALSPNPLALGRVFLSLALGRAALELGAEASLPSTVHDQGAAGFQDQLMLGTLAACGERLSIYLCAVGKLGLIRVHGVGLERPFSPTGLLAQSGVRLSYSLALGHRLAVLAHGDALYLLSPWTVDVNGAATWRMPRLGTEAGIDLGIKFR